MRGIEGLRQVTDAYTFATIVDMADVLRTSAREDRESGPLRQGRSVNIM